MRIAFLSTIILGWLALSACNSMKKTSTGQTQSKNDLEYQLTDQKWLLTELKGKPVAEKVNGKEPYLILHTVENRYSASGGCNGMGGIFTLGENGKIEFSQGMSTMMACQDMSVEMGLKEVLGSADNFAIKGDVLSLNKAKMAPLAKFRAQTADEAALALNGTWEVTYVSGSNEEFSALYPNKKPTISFNLPDTFAVGNSSCNSYRTKFTLNGKYISFEPPVTTKVFCGGNGEAAFYKTLKQVNQFGVSGNMMTLIKGDLAIMRLQKIK